MTPLAAILGLVAVAVAGRVVGLYLARRSAHLAWWGAVGGFLIGAIAVQVRTRVLTPPPLAAPDMGQPRGQLVAVPDEQTQARAWESEGGGS